MERAVVRHQRVHPVDRDELLGERVRRAVVIGLRADDAAEQFVVVEERERPPAVLAGKPVPVHVHRHLDDRVRQDRRRPLDGVDLRHERRVDQPRLRERAASSFQSGCSCASRSQMSLCSSVNSVWSIASPIHQLSVKPVKLHARLRIDRQQPGRLEPELAADRPSAASRPTSGSRAVDLRRVPPVAVQIDVGGRPRRSGGRRHRARCAARASLGSPQSSPGGERDVDEVGRRRACARTSRAP